VGGALFIAVGVEVGVPTVSVDGRAVELGSGVRVGMAVAVSTAAGIRVAV